MIHNYTIYKLFISCFLNYRKTRWNLHKLEKLFKLNCIIDALDEDRMILL